MKKMLFLALMANLACAVQEPIRYNDPDDERQHVAKGCSFNPFAFIPSSASLVKKLVQHLVTSVEQVVQDNYQIGVPAPGKKLKTD